MRIRVATLVVLLAIAPTIALSPTPARAQASADTVRVRRGRPLPGALRRQLQRAERERQKRDDRRRRVEKGPADVPDRMLERREGFPRESDLDLGVFARGGQSRGLGLFGGPLNPLGTGLDFSSWLRSMAYGRLSPFGSLGYGARSLFGSLGYGARSPLGYDLPFPGYGTGSPLFGGGAIRSPYPSTGRLSWPGRLTDLYRSPLDFYVYDEDYYWPYSELFEGLYRPLSRGGRAPGLGGCVFVLGRGTVCPGVSSSAFPRFKESPRRRNQ